MVCREVIRLKAANAISVKLMKASGLLDAKGVISIPDTDRGFEGCGDAATAYAQDDLPHEANSFITNSCNRLHNARSGEFS